MATKNKTAEVNAEVKRGRGRPALPLVLPESKKFTISDILAANPTVKARLTIYNQIDAGTLEIHATGEVAERTGLPGKPGDLFMRLSDWKRSQSAKKAAKVAAKNRKAKLASVPTVDLTPAPAAEVPAAPVVEPVADPVTA